LIYFVETIALLTNVANIFEHFENFGRLAHGKDRNSASCQDTRKTFLEHRRYSTCCMSYAFRQQKACVT